MKLVAVFTLIPVGILVGAWTVMLVAGIVAAAIGFAPLAFGFGTAFAIACVQGVSAFFAGLVKGFFEEL